MTLLLMLFQNCQPKRNPIVEYRPEGALVNIQSDLTYPHTSTQDEIADKVSELDK